MSIEVPCELCGVGIREHSDHECDRDAMIDHQRTEARADAIADVVEWLRGIPEDWRHDWGLNATEEIADLLGSGLWLFDGIGPEPDVRSNGGPE